MARRRLYGNRSPLIGGKRRETSWFSIGLVQSSNAGTGSSLLAVLNAAALAKRPFTVVRVHMTVQVRTDNIASETQIAAIGMAVVSDQASAAGVASVPTPITDLASDLFFVHKIIMGHNAFSTAAAFSIPGGTVVDIDSKAMRKVNDDQDVIITAEGGADGFVIDVMGRMLIKES